MSQTSTSSRLSYGAIQSGFMRFNSSQVLVEFHRTSVEAMVLRKSSAVKAVSWLHSVGKLKSIQSIRNRWFIKFRWGFSSRTRNATEHSLQTIWRHDLIQAKSAQYSEYIGSAQGSPFNDKQSTGCSASVYVSSVRVRCGSRIDNIQVG
jgi:hypothetical protein